MHRAIHINNFIPYKYQSLKLFNIMNFSHIIPLNPPNILCFVDFFVIFFRNSSIVIYIFCFFQKSLNRKIINFKEEESSLSLLLIYSIWPWDQRSVIFIIWNFWNLFRLLLGDIITYSIFRSEPCAIEWNIGNETI